MTTMHVWKEVLLIHVSTSDVLTIKYDTLCYENKLIT